MLWMLARWTAWVVGSLTAALALICSPVLLWLLYLWIIEPPAVPLTVGLSGTWAAWSSELDRRVKVSFPPGSSETQMASELRQQGFSQRDLGSSTEKEHWAVRREDSFPCNKAAYVYWRADDDGRLISIRGDYPMGQCL